MMMLSRREAGAVLQGRELFFKAGMPFVNEGGRMSFVDKGRHRMLKREGGRHSLREGGHCSLS